MKKKIILLFALAWAAGALAGCQGNANGAAPEESRETSAGQETVSAETGTEADEPETDTEIAEGTADYGNVLVVYYSATGTTARVAGQIAEITGGRTFELEPVEPYSSEELDWTDENSRVSQEYENPDSRAVELAADTVEDWESYDTVFVGYPIWWGIAAWPVNSFVEANDFTGKTVIPFCTASSSGIGESGELLEELAGTGTWLEGDRFRSSTSAEDLQAWIKGLEIQ